jgi:hypothetical protein
MLRGTKKRKGQKWEDLYCRNLSGLLPTLVDALKPIHHFLVILSHPVEIVIGLFDRLPSSSFRTAKYVTLFLPELNQLLRTSNRKFRIDQWVIFASWFTSFNSSSVLNDVDTAVMMAGKNLVGTLIVNQTNCLRWRRILAVVITYISRNFVHFSRIKLKDK